MERTLGREPLCTASCLVMPCRHFCQGKMATETKHPIILVAVIIK